MLHPSPCPTHVDMSEQSFCEYAALCYCHAEQNKKIIVEEVADGSAGQNANVKVGDILRGTTARSKARRLPSPSRRETANAI